MAYLGERTKPLLKFSESIFIPIIIIMMGYYFIPSDPLLLHQSFPWIWIGPILIALRYGQRFGLFSILFIILGIIYTLRYDEFTWDDYTLWLMGGILVTLICGGFYDIYFKRIRYFNRQHQYLLNELNHVAYANQMLRLSHNFLEQSLAARPVTLRGALIDLRNLLKYDVNIFSEETAQQFMQLMSYYAALESGGLYMVKNDEVNKSPIAWLGQKADLILDDYMVINSLETKKSNYIVENKVLNQIKPNYLAVIPLVTSEHKLIALLTVTTLPFLSLHEETIRTLTILCSYFADQATIVQFVHLLRQKYQKFDPNFLAEIMKLQHIANEIKVDSVLVVFKILPNEQAENVIYTLQYQQRDSDYLCVISEDNFSVVMVLLPFAREGVVKGYIDRINDLFKNLFDMQIGESFVSMKIYYLSSYKKPDDLIQVALRDL